MDVWFTSDTHYGHARIIQYCGRPFSSVEEMDEAMVERWNKVVRPGDHVYHLGDVMMGQNMAERLTALRKRLTGEITLILGNHDRGQRVYLKAGFERVMRKFTCIGPRKSGIIFMRHHPPMLPVDWEAGGTLNTLYLCGHVHEAWARHGNVINVGVDVRNFTPVSLDELLATPDSL